MAKRKTLVKNIEETKPILDISDVPKNFIIRCKRCNWSELNTGIKQDLVKFVEFKNNCENCGKPRRFKCPNCSSIAIMKRV